jgi:hypothetical protein
MNWVQDGDSWAAVAWVLDTQVIYVVAREGAGPGHYLAQRTVVGPDHPEVVTVGSDPFADKVKAAAQADLEELQKKGF